MKDKMTKREIAKIKRTAKLRKNRRMTSGEYDRTMAQAQYEIGLNDAHIPIVDLSDMTSDDSYVVTGSGQIEIAVPEVVDQKLAKELGPDISKEDCEKLIKRAMATSPYHDLPAHYDARASKARKEMTRKNMTELILQSLEHDKIPKVRAQFEEMVGGKKRPFKDILAILHYLAYPVPGRMPFCLLPRAQKTNTVRKIVKPKGDIKIRPLRVIPNDEYFREMQGLKRTRLDAFDEMGMEKKIRWARYANQIIGFNSEEDWRRYRITSEGGYRSVMLAMKYACKMMGASEFRGIFANPYWVLLRTNKYYYRMTNKEHKVFDDIAFKHLDPHGKSSRVIDAEKALTLLLPTLKKMGLYQKYVSEVESRRSSFVQKLELVRELMAGKLVNA